MITPRTEIEPVQRRERRVNIRVNSTEYDALEAAAGAEDVSTWVRKQALSVVSQPLSMKLDVVLIRLAEMQLAVEIVAEKSTILESKMAGLISDVHISDRKNELSQVKVTPDRRIDDLQKQVLGLTETLKNAHKIHAQQLSNILARLS